MIIIDKTSMEFGGLISTSNMPVSDHVMVSSDTDLVWTISLQHLLARLREHISLRNKVIISYCLHNHLEILISIIIAFMKTLRLLKPWYLSAKNQTYAMHNCFECFDAINHRSGVKVSI